MSSTAPPDGTAAPASKRAYVPSGPTPVTVRPLRVNALASAFVSATQRAGADDPAHLLRALQDQQRRERERGGGADDQ